MSKIQFKRLIHYGTTLFTGVSVSAKWKTDTSEVLISAKYSIFENKVMYGSSDTYSIKQFTLEYMYCLLKTQIKKLFYYTYLWLCWGQLVGAGSTV